MCNYCCVGLVNTQFLYANPVFAGVKFTPKPNMGIVISVFSQELTINWQPSAQCFKVRDVLRVGFLFELRFIENYQSKIITTVAEQEVLLDDGKKK